MQPSGETSSSSSTPMDVDPIDGGPRPVPTAHTKGAAANTGGPSVMNSLLLMDASQNPPSEEEARQAIEMLRGDDLSARVAAAHRLDSVAAVLGEERTRNVRVCPPPRFLVFSHKPPRSPILTDRF